MTTVAQVRKMVKPLLERHSDLALVGRWIFVKPVHHFARAVLIDRYSNPLSFNPCWAVVHLFEWQRFFPLSWGEPLCNEASARPGVWLLSEPGVDAALHAEIEGKALSALRAIETLDDFLAYVSNHYFRHHLYEWASTRIIVETALGDLEAARATAAENLAQWSQPDPECDEEDRAECARLCTLCARLKADDRAGLAQLLHEWEAATVRNLKIEHIWQPTPFPLELAAGNRR